MKWALATIVFFYPFLVFSQSIDISGIVINSENDIPVAGAHIFVSGSLRGTTSNGDGLFELDGLPYNVAEVVISHVSFETRILPLSNNGQENIKITLKPLTIKLSEVSVKEDADRQWKRHFKQFKNAFLGTSELSHKCEIVNPWVLNFTKSSDVLSATGSKMLEIRNEALGYKLYFLLSHFSENGRTVSYSGKFRFKELKSESEKQINTWKKNRQKTYLGSLRHFLSALESNRLRNEGFVVHFARQNSQENDFTISSPVLAEDIIVMDEATGEKSLIYNNFLRIIYTKKNAFDYSGVTPESYPTSYLFLSKSKIRIYPGGLTPDREFIQEFGFWGDSRVAELLPYEYKF